ncbi:MAG: efflux RND transporter periplasmic adaptor subunit [Desulfobulbus sp.]|jgi:Cu(I)/Ag(I) efflux system membrane fusion protein/cobalt-zinc-cadmium efflux system membrane fusion protein|uniref:efflux RND transporter periplasmic adaptor subunit n=1 Tax=Desulfobulbus sp. TaxID=895 RepID=UPI002846112C|nr:efflux RND transporter periplasmic adaptor subunit [Desulfobulbus sp.]MDR2551014.1 efflux RND transporter periplasmic adaptor subunit [Desulfobulbus sp.]
MRTTTAAKTVAALVCLALALAGGYLLGLSRHDHGATAPTAGDAAKVQYTCSMHPFIIRDAPGACPICGMALTPVKTGVGAADGAANGQEAAPGSIEIDPVTLQNMGLRTEPATRRALQRTIQTVGLVTAADDRQFAVTAKIEGWVERLYVNQLGQQVKKGQPLLDIYSPELVAAQQEYLLAVANRQRLATSPYPEIAANAERLVEAARTRMRYWDISPEQLRTLEQTGRVRKTLTLASEYGGVVVKKSVLAGARIMAGEELLQIADLSTVWVLADIYEYELPWVRIGQAVRVTLPYVGDSDGKTGGESVAGTIAYLYPTLESETRTVKARIEVANPGLSLKPAMYAQVAIAAGASAETLTIPASAVLNSGREQTVFVALGQGRFAPRQVTCGLRDDQGFIQILSGLDPGEAVVVSAQFMLDSESRLREALDKMLGPKPGQTEARAQQTPAAAPPATHSKDLDELFK